MIIVLYDKFPMVCIYIEFKKIKLNLINFSFGSLVNVHRSIVVEYHYYSIIPFVHQIIFKLALLLNYFLNDDDELI